MTWTLSEDQQAARVAVHAALAGGKRVSVLVGPAGSGKTTLMQSIIDDVASKREVVLICPTGKAASVLQKKTGRVAGTVHKALYGSVWEDGDDVVGGKVEDRSSELNFGDPHPPCGPGGLVVCDEASMVGESLHGDLVAQLKRRDGAQLLYVGDREQLPPVGEEWGPNFDRPDAALDQVHRQAEGSPILQLATAIRWKQSWAGWVPGRCERGPGHPVAWLAERADGDATLLAYTNKVRRAMNHDVRKVLGKSGALAVGDRIVCLLNSNLGMMNGEVATVVGMRTARAVTTLELDNGIEAKVNLSLLGGSVRDFRKWQGKKEGCLHIDHGWCLTVHKSQGSEWEHVGFVADGAYQWLKRDKPDEARRLAYTAVTRASQTLRIFTGGAS